jgi:hypothetical protein
MVGSRPEEAPVRSQHRSSRGENGFYIILGNVPFLAAILGGRRG